MDETGHPGADAPAGGNGAGERGGSHDSTPWPANGSSSLEALAGWGQPGDRSGQGANGNGRSGGGGTGRAAVGSARVGDNTSIRARAEMRVPYADLIAPLPPPAAVVNGDDPTRGGQPRHGAEVDDHPINGSARPLTLAEHSAMMENLPYADRQPTADHRIGRSPVGYFTPYPAEADEEAEPAGSAAGPVGLVQPGGPVGLVPPVGSVGLVQPGGPVGPVQPGGPVGLVPPVGPDAVAAPEPVVHDVTPLPLPAAPALPVAPAPAPPAPPIVPGRPPLAVVPPLPDSPPDSPPVAPSPASPSGSSAPTVVPSSQAHASAPPSARPVSAAPSSRPVSPAGRPVSPAGRPVSPAAGESPFSPLSPARSTGQSASRPVSPAPTFPTYSPTTLDATSRSLYSKTPPPYGTAAESGSPAADGPVPAGHPVPADGPVRPVSPAPASTVPAPAASAAPVPAPPTPAGYQPAPGYQPSDFGSGEHTEYASRFGYPPVANPPVSGLPVSSPPVSGPPRADAGRHSHPVGDPDYSDQPEPRWQQPPTPGGRHHGEVGEEPVDRSPWAPPGLPPGYERIPVARTSPPPEYEETPAYQDSPAAVSRPYVRPVDQGPRNESSQWAEPRLTRAQAVEPGDRTRPAERGRRAAPEPPTPAPRTETSHADMPRAEMPRAEMPPEAARPVEPPARPDLPPYQQRSADSPWREPHWSEGPVRWSDPPGQDQPAAGAGHAPVLPQRVPAEPDVPGVLHVPGVEPEVAAEPAAVPELTRIATYLRDEDEEGAAVRPDGFDIPAVLAAVRLVAGVREAQVRTSPGGAHTLRLELADDADPGEVSRMVTRLLNERMGLAAEPSDDLLGALPPPAPPARRHAVTPQDDPAQAELGPPARFAPTAQARVAPTRAESRPGPRATDSAAPTNGPLSAVEHGQPPARPPFAAADQRPPSAAAEARPPLAAAARAADQRPGEPARASAGTRDAEVRTIEGRSAGMRGAGSRAARRAAENLGSEPGWAAATQAYPHLAEPAPDSVPAHRPLPGGPGAPRVVLDQVEVSTHGTDALVEVRLSAGNGPAVGVASGPAFDGYVLRLAAVAAANAIDDLMADSSGVPRARCFIENATVVPMGSCEVAVVVLLLAHSGWVEQLSGSAVVNTDQRQAVVCATLAAVNRRLEALLP